MAVDVEIDVELLKNEIRKTYAAVCAEPGPRQRPGPARHRPLDRLNCRGAAGGSVREAPGEARLRADRDRSTGRYLRALEVLGHQA